MIIVACVLVVIAETELIVGAITWPSVTVTTTLVYSYMDPLVPAIVML